MAARKKRIVRECRTHGMTVFALEKTNGYRCCKCRNARVARWRRDAKSMLLDMHGNACVNCGYSRCKRALSFHHVDPDKKSFTISHWLRLNRAALIAEAEKCVLLCANCHMELEDGLITLGSRSRGAAPL